MPKRFEAVAGRRELGRIDRIDDAARPIAASGAGPIEPSSITTVTWLSEVNSDLRAHALAVSGSLNRPALGAWFVVSSSGGGVTHR